MSAPPLNARGCARGERFVAPLPCCWLRRGCRCAVGRIDQAGRGAAASRTRVSATTRSANAGSRSWAEASIGLPFSSSYIPVCRVSPVRTRVMTWAARLGVLQYGMRGASGPRTYLASRRSARFASRPRPVVGLNPGSMASNRSRGVSRVEREDGGEVGLLGGGVRVVAGLGGPAGLPSPRALASAEMSRPPRIPR